MKQHRPFQVVIGETTKATLRENAKRFGKPYGVFFSTSGKALVEQINPTAQYEYVWRTDRDK